MEDEGEGQISRDIIGRKILRYKSSKILQNNLKYAVALGTELLLEAGATQVYVPHQNLDSIEKSQDISWIFSESLSFSGWRIFSNYQSGSCRMGSVESTSVTNGYGEIWGLENLFIQDASILPGANNSGLALGIMALACINSEFIIENHRKYFIA